MGKQGHFPLPTPTPNPTFQSVRDRLIGWRTFSIVPFVKERIFAVYSLGKIQDGSRGINENRFGVYILQSLFLRSKTGQHGYILEMVISCENSYGIHVSPRKVSNRKTGISFQSFTFCSNRPLHRSPFDGLPPFHGFFSLWHGPVRENPSTPLVLERLERLKISIITKFESEIWGEDKAPQFCENLQTFVWWGTSLWRPLPPPPTPQTYYSKRL